MTTALKPMSLEFEFRLSLVAAHFRADARRMPENVALAWLLAQLLVAAATMGQGAAGGHCRSAAQARPVADGRRSCSEGRGRHRGQRVACTRLGADRGIASHRQGVAQQRRAVPAHSGSSG